MSPEITRENSRPMAGGSTRTAEASDLGLAPGHWPMALPTALGNGQWLLREAEIQGTEFVEYVQECGTLILCVYND